MGHFNNSADEVLGDSSSCYHSTLPGRVGNGVQLTSLSPLSDRSKLCASPALENVAAGLTQFGYQVGWENGRFEVSSAQNSRRPSDAPVSLSLDSFMGGQTRKRDSYGYRPKVASSVTFSKGTSGLKPATEAGLKAIPSPSTQAQSASDSQLRSPQHTSTPPPPPPAAASAPNMRFSRLAQSVDSLQQLQVPIGSNINSNNLVTLSHSTTWQPMASGPRPGTAPATRRQSPPDIGCVTDQRPSTAMSREEYSAHTGSDGPRQGETAAGVPGPSRPTTAFVDLTKDAGAALRPSIGVSVSMRPHSTRPSSRPYSSHSSGASFRPSRGHALVVFQHMDKDKNGKVTLSELEEAALAVGFSLEQAHKLFKRMDKSGKGYLQASDWGNVEMNKVVELFSLVYMQRFLGLPGPTAQPEQVKRYWALQDLKAVRSMAAAIHMARSNAILRGSHSTSSSGNVIFEAFRFIDTDGSGRLSYEELRDGFYALGVFVKDEVMQQMMAHFDTNNDGAINYYEFVQKMFPSNTSRGMR